MKKRTSLFLSFLIIVSLNDLTTNQATAQQKPAQFDTTLFHDMQFRPVGPTRGGRVTAVEGHRAHPHKFYMGGAGGSGIWKTENYGQTWVNISDGQGFKSTSIGALEVADSDTSIIYAGTGTDGIRANVTTGRGVYKSTDAGQSWQFLGLEEAGQIGAIEVHPENPDRVYLAALGHPFGKNKQRGIFRSKDGGQNWEKVFFASDSTGAIDLELNTEHPNEIYAAMWRAERKPWTIISGAAKENGLYKSTDGGDSWKQMTNGLPDSLTGKADFAVTPADPDRIYALLEAPGKKQGLYRSDDRGESWKQMSDTTGTIMTRPFYFTNITAHPTNPDKVYVGNVRYWVSEDGGKTFERRNVTHADVHDLWINPEQPDIQVQGNDGGATVTLDGGKTWSTQLNQPTAELYQVNVDNRFPYRLYAGQQDNSTIVVPSLPPYESPAGPRGWWETAGGCETGPIVPVPNTGKTVYANCKGRFGQYNTTTGQQKNFYVGAEYMYGRNPADLSYRFQRVAPIEISPLDSTVVYHGSQYLHRTTNGGENWEQISPDLTAFKPQFQMASGGPITRDITGEEHFSTLYSISASPHNKDVIWTGANDGPVHISRDGGRSWTDITPKNLPPNGRVDAIEPSPHQAGTAYIAAVRRKLDDFEPYIYKTDDYGQSWEKLTSGNGIPDGYPTRVVREDPERKGLLYAGTDWGLFASFDFGQNWQQIKLGLPNTPITDIRVHRGDLALSTMGRGFWILDNVSVLRQLDDSLATGQNHLFKPQNAYRMRYRGGSYASGAPKYIEPGAVIDFYVPDTTGAPVVLEIQDVQGDPVRSFVGRFDDESNAADDEETGDESDMMMPEKIPGTAGSFALKNGHNRFIWDLRYPGETIIGTDDETCYGPGTGPAAVPGSYSVRLRQGEWSHEQPLTVRMDPRVEAEGTTVEDLQAQLDFSLHLRNAIGRAERMAADADSLTSTLKTRLADHPDDQFLTDALENLAQFRSRLVTSEEGSYQPPMLIDQMEYLYYPLIRADQAPGNEAFKRYEMLRKELHEVIAQWQQLEQQIKDDMGELNEGHSN